MKRFSNAPRQRLPKLWARSRLGLLAVGLLMVGSVSPALAGKSATLHPSGFGPHSYASWKAHEGLEDTRGNDSQSLYFQKMTATATVAAGVVLIRGFEGLPLEDLEGLAWDHRTDGHCGAGAPRWNVNVTNEITGMNQTLFLGCFAAAHSAVVESDPDHDWCRDTQPTAFAVANEALFTVRNLAIVFDEGTDNPIPQPPGCPVGPSTPGFVHLDNITVEASGVTHVWTSANDNGTGGTTSANTTLTATELEDALGAPLESLLRQ